MQTAFARTYIPNPTVQELAAKKKYYCDGGFLHTVKCSGPKSGPKIPLCKQS